MLNLRTLILGLPRTCLQTGLQNEPEYSEKLSEFGTANWTPYQIAQFTAWPILTGIVIGYVANRIMSGEGKGCCMNLIVGIAGSYAGAFISSLFDIDLFGAGYLKNFLFCVIGAVIVLWIWKKLFE